ncbi:hypothetical protein ACP4OV_017368 [Aristida adscensionis]
MVASFPQGKQARPRGGVDGTELHTEGALGVPLRPRSRTSPARAAAIRLLLQGSAGVSHGTDGTCALVAAAVCLEAQHRREFEAVNGAGTFPCHAAAPRKLRQACRREKRWVEQEAAMKRTWEPKEGVRYLGRVLDKMIQLGGLPTTNAPPPAPHSLRLASWERHHRRDGLTADFAARLIHERGPCVGVLFITPAYHVLDASRDGGDAVFRGCPRSMRGWWRHVDGAGYHAVVCFQYRHDHGELQILILDNHSPTGPPRWISFDEIDDMFTLTVQAMPSEGRLGQPPPLVYPRSGT